MYKSDDSKNYNKTKKTRFFILKIILTILLAIPFEIIVLLVVLVLVNILGFLGVAGCFSSAGNKMIDIGRIWEFWPISFTIFSIHVLIYSLLIRIGKTESIKNFRYFLLGALFVVVVFLAPYMGKPRGSWILGDIQYIISNIYLITLFLFITFTISTVLFDNNSKMSEHKKIWSSVGIASVAGTIISSIVWSIIFNIFHEWK